MAEQHKQETYRTLFSWRDEAPSEQKELRRIDRLCKRIALLPSMRGLVDFAPDVAKTAIMSKPDKKSPDYARYLFEAGRVELNFSFARAGDLKKFSRNDILTAYLAHEIRHAYQDAKGRFDHMNGFGYANNIEARSVFWQINEADATAFAATIAYEFHLAAGNNAPWKAMQVEDNASRYAYMKAIKKDPQSHWDGRAAHAAFRAYFSMTNRGALECYEKIIRSGFEETASQAALTCNLGKAMERYIRPLRLMPYSDEQGRQHHRFYYGKIANMKVAEIMAHIPRDVPEAPALAA